MKLHQPIGNAALGHALAES